VVCVLLSTAHQVFDEMAARASLLNFAKLFGGGDSNIIGHMLVVVVCKMKLV
jgi:hypothetical protein